MRGQKLMIGTCGLMVSLASSGCVIVVNGGWADRSHVWTTATEERTFDTQGVSGLDVQTHNGSIDFEGQATESTEGGVTITKKAGGATQAEAEKAMSAIEVFVEPSGGKVRIGWRWNTPKKRNWYGDVSFAVRAPRNVNLDAETHNGPITVTSIDGEVRVVSHNGEINVNSAGGSLSAETHNGQIEAVYAGGRVNLNTHNGEVIADLSRCGDVTGSVTSHNGAVRLSVGRQTSTSLRCRTHNGRVDCDAPLSEIRKSRGELDGKLGEGGGKLEVETHNGGIAIKSQAG